VGQSAVHQAQAARGLERLHKRRCRRYLHAKLISAATSKTPPTTDAADVHAAACQFLDVADLSISTETLLKALREFINALEFPHHTPEWRKAFVDAVVKHGEWEIQRRRDAARERSGQS